MMVIKNLEPLLSEKLNELNMTIPEFMRIGKLSLVCKDSINRAAIDQGMVFLL